MGGQPKAHGTTTTSMLRNLQQQFPIGDQPIVKTWRLRWLQVLDDTDVVGSPPCELAPNRCISVGQDDDAGASTLGRPSIDHKAISSGYDHAAALRWRKPESA